MYNSSSLDITVVCDSIRNGSCLIFILSEGIPEKSNLLLSTSKLTQNQTECLENTSFLAALSTGKNMYNSLNCHSLRSTSWAYSSPFVMIIWYAVCCFLDQSSLLTASSNHASLESQLYSRNNRPACKLNVVFRGTDNSKLLLSQISYDHRSSYALAELSTADNTRYFPIQMFGKETATSTH